MAEKFDIISQRPMTEFNPAGIPVDKVEITFSWNDGFVGSVRVSRDTSTPEEIREKILDHIRRFTVASE